MSKMMISMFRIHSVLAFYGFGGVVNASRLLDMIPMLLINMYVQYDRHESFCICSSLCIVSYRLRILSHIILRWCMSFVSLPVLDSHT